LCSDFMAYKLHNEHQRESRCTLELTPTPQVHTVCALILWRTNYTMNTKEKAGVP
jgi:hypothetical protein